jgi:Putative inner membrane protein (DUF1819)
VHIACDGRSLHAELGAAEEGGDDFCHAERRHRTNFRRSLEKRVEGKTGGHWSEPTITRTAQGLLSAIRDFGILQGAVNKKIAPAHVPIESFAYIVFYLKQHQPSGMKLIESPDWKLFFLSSEGVERLLFEAHQHNLLE